MAAAGGSAARPKRSKSLRPEYRRLSLLREHFPDASLHAFTATATPRVRHDIADQLQLRDPAVLVGCFDRPNLNYRILPLVDVRQQTLDALMKLDLSAGVDVEIRT